MQTKKYIIQRIIKGLIAFVLITAMLATIYEIYYEVTKRPDIELAIKSIMSGKILAGELEGKTLEEEKAIRAEARFQAFAMYGLHRPRTVRIFERTYKAVTLDLGEASYKFGVQEEGTIKDAIFRALPNTMILFVSSTIVSILIAVYLGVKKAQYVNSFFDRVTSMLTMFFIGIPAWVTGSFLILFFVYYLKILPFGSLYSTNPPPVGMINIILDRIKHMLIPIMAIVLVRVWGSAYQIRNILLGHLQEDYIHSARGRGLPERKILFGHALRTAFPAVITLALLSIVEAVSGDIVLEKVLAWPGLGLLLWKAIVAGHMDLILGITTILTLIFVVALVFLDIIYVALDPRIKYS